MLISNLVSGALFLLLLTALGFWSLFLSGAGYLVLLLVVGYVVAGSLFLSAVYAREALTMRQEALAWLAPWLVAVTLWSLMGAGIFGLAESGSDWFLTLWFGLVIATPCFVAWQVVALAVRQFMAWRSRT